MIGRLGPAGRLLLGFGAVSFAAVAVGAAICAASGVPTGLWVRNLVAWAAGGAAALGLARAAGPRTVAAAVWLAPAGLAGCFLSPDLDGAHRWIDLGPLQMNMAMLLLPMAAVALAMRADRRGSRIAAVLALVVLVVQPDASQATAFAAVVALVAATLATRLRFVLMAAAALAAAAWLQPDPLQPVPEVEDVLELAWSVSPALAVLAGLLLAALAAAPVLLARAAPPGPRLAGLALGLLLLLWSATTFLGAFPVPLVGVGLSPILGGWLGAGMLAAVMRRSAQVSAG